jgi:hypothetical protein
VIGTPLEAYNPSNRKALRILPALREMLGNHPHLTECSPETLAELLRECRYLPQQPADHQVEVALETLRVEDGVLA